MVEDAIDSRCNDGRGAGPRRVGLCSRHASRRCRLTSRPVVQELRQSGFGEIIPRSDALGGSGEPAMAIFQQGDIGPSEICEGFCALAPRATWSTTALRLAELHCHHLPRRLGVLRERFVELICPALQALAHFGVASLRGVEIQLVLSRIFLALVDLQQSCQYFEGVRR